MKRSFLALTLLTAACANNTAIDVATDALEGTRSPAQIVEESAPADWRVLDPENMLVIELERGRVVIALSDTLAQNHVSQVKALAREGFYDGLSFYRVIDGFVAQGGDVFETREIKNAETSLAAEFEEIVGDTFPFDALSLVDGYAAEIGFSQSLPVGRDPETNSAWHLHCTGAFAFGRTNERDSASTEFYIALQPQRYLDRNLSVFGRVVEGMEHLQALRRVAPAQTPEDDTGETILSMRVAADLPEGERPALEIMRSDTQTFTEYVESRSNRPEEFFYFRPDHVDVCAIAIPVRAITTE